MGGDRLDNTISYATPTIAGGLQLFAQYSFQTGTNADPGVEESKERHNTRRASAAFRWQGQSLTAVGVFDRIMNTHKDGADYGEDTTIASLTVNFLVHPDVRLFVVGQGFKTSTVRRARLNILSASSSVRGISPPTINPALPDAVLTAG